MVLKPPFTEYIILSLMILEPTTLLAFSVPIILTTSFTKCLRVVGTLVGKIEILVLEINYRVTKFKTFQMKILMFNRLVSKQKLTLIETYFSFENLQFS
jgi:hypothetical protein